MSAKKMTDASMHKTTVTLATAGDADFEGDQGVSFASLTALIMQRYLYGHRWKHTDFAQVFINAHENAMKNPNARLRDQISVAEYRKERMIATSTAGYIRKVYKLALPEDTAAPFAVRLSN